MSQNRKNATLDRQPSTGSEVEPPMPPERVETSPQARSPYSVPRLSQWGTLEDLTLGPLFPNDDMDATGSQPI